MVIREDYLAHHGVKGQQHGVRRYQNEDGSLTPEGRIHYGYKSEYSGLSNEDINKRLTVYRDRAQYVSYATEKANKKKSDIEGLFKTAGAGTKTVTGTLNTVRGAELRAKRTDENAAEVDKKLAGYKKAADVGDKIGTATNSYSGTVADMMTKGDRKVATEQANNNISELSDEQLHQLVNRMNLERQLDAYEHPPKKSTLEKGKEFLDGAFKVMGAVLLAAQTIDVLRGISAKKQESKNKNKDKDDEATHSAVLMHYGVKGMRKGERRYQNPDGSLTPEGYRHYGIDPNAKDATKQLAGLQRHNYLRERSVSEQRQDQYIQKQQLKSQAKYDRAVFRQEAKLRKADAKNERKLSQLQFRQDLKQQKQMDKQALNTERREKQLELDAKRAAKDINRRNFFKYAIGSVALAGVAYLGFSHIHNKNLNFKNNLKLKEIKAKGEVELEKLGLTNKGKQIDADKEVEQERLKQETARRQNELNAETTRRKDEQDAETARQKEETARQKTAQEEATKRNKDNAEWGKETEKTKQEAEKTKQTELSTAVARSEEETKRRAADLKYEQDKEKEQSDAEAEVRKAKAEYEAAEAAVKEGRVKDRVIKKQNKAVRKLTKEANEAEEAANNIKAKFDKKYKGVDIKKLTPESKAIYDQDKEVVNTYAARKDSASAALTKAQTAFDTSKGLKSTVTEKQNAYENAIGILDKILKRNKR